MSSAVVSNGPHGSGEPQISRLVGHGTAHAKVILLGEHSVVYGLPAVALPILRLAVRAQATEISGASRLDTEGYDGTLADAPASVAPLVTAVSATLAALGRPGASVAVRLRSDFPIGRGLGSSAAAANAIVDALCVLFDADPDEQERFDLVQAAERVAHGTPSGLDARTTRAAHPLRFVAGAAERVPVDFGTDFIVADTGLRGETRRAVAVVRAAVDSEPDARRRLDRLAELTETAAVCLASDDRAALGEAMDEAHGILTGLGVGHPALDAVVLAARNAGALGAKLTGSGQGGCVIALAPSPAESERIADAMLAAGAVSSWVVRAGEYQ
ncbi:mevalonate kinase [Microbacteriaceae bacterium VKM Ac-2855]|nr:mevalonate kinase [Microbacteriaceae bacterium VKM Ac-2855]